jgi:hypothetical protein
MCAILSLLQTSVLGAIFESFKSKFCYAASQKLVQDLLTFATPLLLKLIIR